MNNITFPIVSIAPAPILKHSHPDFILVPLLHMIKDRFELFYVLR